jgi:hypothetical protein
VSKRERKMSIGQRTVLGKLPSFWVVGMRAAEAFGMEPDPNGIKFKGKGIERTPQSLAGGLDEGLFEGPEPKEQVALALGRLNQSGSTGDKPPDHPLCFRFITLS